MEQKSLDVSGKSVDEAVFVGLTQLGATLDEVHIEIVKEETKGVLGIGARQALVRLTLRDPEELKALYEQEQAAKDEQEYHRQERYEPREPRPMQHERHGDGRGGRDRQRGGSGRPERSGDHRRREAFVDDDPAYDIPSDNVAATFLRGVLDRMGVNSKLAVREEEEAIRIKIQSDSMGVLIGHRGETLDSLQYLCSLVLNRGQKNYTRLTLDTENYRVKREETLVRLAERLAGQVSQTGDSVTLEPMNPYERRILHSSLQNHPDVYTYSEGEEPNRKVVIAMKQ